MRTWLHCAHLQMGGQKMAKSERQHRGRGGGPGRGLAPRALRYALIAAHYRTGLSFSDESLSAAAAAVARLDALVAALLGYHGDGPDDPELPAAIAGTRASFSAAIDDDLGISRGPRVGVRPGPRR